MNGEAQRGEIKRKQEGRLREQMTNRRPTELEKTLSGNVQLEPGSWVWGSDQGLCLPRPVNGQAGCGEGHRGKAPASSQP